MKTIFVIEVFVIVHPGPITGLVLLGVSVPHAVFPIPRYAQAGITCFLWIAAGQVIGNEAAVFIQDRSAGGTLTLILQLVPEVSAVVSSYIVLILGGGQRIEYLDACIVLILHQGFVFRLA